MVGDPYESYSDKDGGQGGKEVMNTNDERVGSKMYWRWLTRRKGNLNRLGRSGNGRGNGIG